MNEDLKVPTEIAEIIEQKKLAMQAKQEKDEGIKAEKRKALIETGREKLRLVIIETKSSVPEWLWKYDVTEITFGDDDLERIGDGYNKLDYIWLQFHIPGLAPIEFRTGDWRSARAYMSWREYGTDLPELGFNNSSYWRSDLEYTLIEAEQELQSFAQLQKEYQEKIAGEQRYAEQNTRREEDANARRAAEQTIRETEERELFNVFKDDPVAINLMKAFLMINQERSTFNAQLEDANETMYSIEERWSHRADDLRHQAEHAQRMADEERDRVSSLQSDLDDAKNKLKKAQRGW